jgi:hypothetical protein
MCSDDVVSLRACATRCYLARRASARTFFLHCFAWCCESVPSSQCPYNTVLSCCRSTGNGQMRWTMVDVLKHPDLACKWLCGLGGTPLLHSQQPWRQSRATQTSRIVPAGERARQLSRCPLALGSLASGSWSA